VGDALDRHDLLRQPLPCGHRVPVAGKGDFVLPSARDVPLRPGELHVLAHAEAGGGLAERRRVRPAEPLHTAGDSSADTTARDGVRNDRRGPEAGDAVGRYGLRLDPGRQAGLEHDLPSEVRLPALGHDHAERHRVDAGRIDLVSLEKTPHRVLRQRQRTKRRKRLARLHERRAGAGYDGNPLIRRDLVLYSPRKRTPSFTNDSAY
jgi:hypothetical protein